MSFSISSQEPLTSTIPLSDAAEDQNVNNINNENSSSTLPATSEDNAPLNKEVVTTRGFESGNMYADMQKNLLLSKLSNNGSILNNKQLEASDSNKNVESKPLTNISSTNAQFVKDLNEIKNVSEQKNSSIIINLPKNSNNGSLSSADLKVEDYDRALLKGMFQQIGLDNVTDKEINSFQQQFQDATGKKFGVNSSLNELKDNTTNGQLKVFVSDYDYAVLSAGKKQIISDRLNNNEVADQAYQKGSQYVDKLMVGYIANQVNAPINLINGSTEPFRAMAGKMGINIPALPKWQAAQESEYWRKDNRIGDAETGATLALGGALGKQFGEQVLKTTTGKVLSAVEASYNIGVGAAGVDPTEKDTNGQYREMGYLERGLRIGGGLLGAYGVSKSLNEIPSAGNTGGKTVATSQTASTLANEAEAVTPEGFRVRIPEEPGLQQADDLNILSRSEKINAVENGSIAGRDKLTQVANEGLDEIAQASIKKLKTKVSAEKLPQIKEQLVTMNVMRTEMMARLNNISKSFKLSQKASSDIGKAVNSFKKHLTQDDLIGALRDTKGLQVRRSGDGYTYDHFEEVKNGLSSLKKAKESLIDEMKNYQPGSNEYRQLSQAADGITETMSRVKKFLEEK